jgi:hypothetical protein
MTNKGSNDLSQYRILSWDVYNLLEDESKTCDALKKNGKGICGKTASFVSDNVFTCKLHKNDNSKPYTKPLVSSKTLQAIALLVINKAEMLINGNDLFSSVSDVVIELQPKVNPKMKFVSHVLFGKMCSMLPSSSIRFVGAARKLKAYTGPEISCEHLGSKYSKRKWLSIQYTRWFLKEKFYKEEGVKWEGFLDGCKNKHDDLCDTFLMAINVLHA